MPKRNEVSLGFQTSWGIGRNDLAASNCG